MHEIVQQEEKLFCGSFRQKVHLHIGTFLDLRERTIFTELRIVLRRSCPLCPRNPPNGVQKLHRGWLCWVYHTGEIPEGKLKWGAVGALPHLPPVPELCRCVFNDSSSHWGPSEVSLSCSLFPSTALQLMHFQ